MKKLVFMLALMASVLVIPLIIAQTQESKPLKIDDIPVIGPKKPKEEPKEDTPPTTSEHAVVPLNLIKNRVDSIRVGDMAYVATNAVKVDSSRRCWLNPNSLTGVKNNDKVIQIRRDSNGFHVILENVEHQWVADDLELTTNWIPVRTIVIK